MSKEPQVRDVVPFKSGKRPTTARKLNLTFAGGTALEEALAGQEKRTNHDSPPLPTTPHHSPDNIAPKKDFNRRANSLDRDALPAGLFRGSSKKLYDALYLRSRGAITPKRHVRASRRELLEWTGIRNLKTIDSHIHYLMAVGLIQRHWELGSTEGSEYEVLLPEELDSPRLTTTHHHSPPDTTSQKMSSGNTQFLGSGGDSQTIDNAATSEASKTDLRLDQKNIDDEAFAMLCEKLQAVSSELTGKQTTTADRARWGEVADVLIAELRIASGRTTVSSVPAFLAEHLRRRLWKIDRKQAQAEGRELPDQPQSKNLLPQGQTCPDCNNTGWWYPHGTEKGVARCKHANLSDSAATEK
ncbi:MAG TPA: hypothetical protein VGB76_00750 [Pyrinomonadaceae bacterium]